MPAFLRNPAEQDIKNLKMHDRAKSESGMAVERVGALELLTGRFGDFDELSAEARGWDLDLVQLEPGSGTPGLTQLLAPDLSIQRFRFGRSCHQRGASPPNMRTFGVEANETPTSRLFGRELAGSDLAVFRTGGEFEAVSQAEVACLAISIDTARLDEAFEAVGMPRQPGLAADESGLLTVDLEVLRRVRRAAAQILDAVESSVGTMGRSERLNELTSQLPIDLALAIQSADGGPRRATSRVRDLARRRAVSFIDDNPDEPITVRALCREAEVSWPTLVHAFREHFGVAPKAYMRARRLNGVRRGLVDAEPETRIADVANRFGFWHLGQFAADYAHLFDELPSDTKRRPRQPRSAGSSASLG